MDPLYAFAAFPHDTEICSSLAIRPVLQEQTSVVVADALEQDILHEVQTF
jgi:predicted dinucleotide-utilizing enzyme